MIYDRRKAISFKKQLQYTAKWVFQKQKRIKSKCIPKLYHSNKKRKNIIFKYLTDRKISTLSLGWSIIISSPSTLMWTRLLNSCADSRLRCWTSSSIWVALKKNSHVMDYCYCYHCSIMYTNKRGKFNFVLQVYVIQNYD